MIVVCISIGSTNWLVFSAARTTFPCACSSVIIIDGRLALSLALSASALKEADVSISDAVRSANRNYHIGADAGTWGAFASFVYSDGRQIKFGASVVFTAQDALVTVGVTIGTTYRLIDRLAVADLLGAYSVSANVNGIFIVPDVLSTDALEDALVGICLSIGAADWLVDVLAFARVRWGWEAGVADGHRGGGGAAIARGGSGTGGCGRTRCGGGGGG